MEKDDGFRLYASECLLKRLQAMMAELEGVKASEDIEYIHRMRVASRRMRSALKVFGCILTKKQRRVWGANFRAITQSLGEARDTDVQIAVIEELASAITDTNANIGIDRITLRLRQKRRKLQADVLNAIRQFEESNLANEVSDVMRRCLVDCRLRDVDTNSSALLMQGLTDISLRLEELLSWSNLITKPENIRELHAMRVAAKRLRYTMELFLPIMPETIQNRLPLVKQLQEILGDIHDSDVWLEMLPCMAEEERRLTMDYFGDARGMKNMSVGFKAVGDNRRILRSDRYSEFIKLWKEHDQLQTWNEWRACLRAAAQNLRSADPSADSNLDDRDADCSDS